MGQGIQASIAIATSPDIETSRRLYQLDDLDAVGVVKAVRHLQKQHKGTEQLPLFLEQIVLIVLCYRQQNDWAYHVLESADEAKLLNEFHQYVKDKGIKLLAWQGSLRDFPILHYRSLKYSLPYMDAERCVDIESAISPYAESTGLSLHEAACLFGMDGVEATLSENIDQAYPIGNIDVFKQNAAAKAKLIMQIAEHIKLV